MDREIEIDLTDASGENFEFKSLRALHEFVSEERDFWKKQHANVGKQSIHRLLNSFNHFEGIADKIDSWSQYIDKWSDDEFSGNIRKLQQENIRHINTDNWLWSKHPAAYPYVSCHKERGHEAATTFINLVLKNNLPNNLNNADVFFGTLAGYEFLVQDSPIVKRKNGEKLSLGRLRNQLAEAKDKLFYEVESFKNEYTEWSNNSRGNFNKLYRVTKKTWRQTKKKRKQSVRQSTSQLVKYN